MSLSTAITKLCLDLLFDGPHSNACRLFDVFPGESLLVVTSRWRLNDSLAYKLIFQQLSVLRGFSRSDHLPPQMKCTTRYLRDRRTGKLNFRLFKGAQSSIITLLLEGRAADYSFAIRFNVIPINKSTELEFAQAKRFTILFLNCSLTPTLAFTR